MRIKIGKRHLSWASLGFTLLFTSAFVVRIWGLMTHDHVPHIWMAVILPALFLICVLAAIWFFREDAS